MADAGLKEDNSKKEIKVPQVMEMKESPTGIGNIKLNEGSEEMELAKKVQPASPLTVI